MERTDIEDGDDETTITRSLAAIGRDAHEMPDSVHRLDGFHACLATCGDARQILGHRGNERMREIRERPADIVRLEWDHTCYRRCEPAEAQSSIEEDRGDVRGAKEVFEVVVRHDQLGDLLLVLGVEGGQLFIYRFEFFVAALQFFISGQQFLIGGLEFLLCGLLVFGRCLQLSFCALQLSFQIGNAPDGFTGRIELVALARGASRLRFLKKDKHRGASGPTPRPVARL